MANMIVLLAKPIPIIETGKIMVDTSNIFLLPNFATKYPDIGSPLIDPVGNANSTVPNAASLMCNCD